MGRCRFGHRDLDTALLGEFERIANQVKKDLPQANRVSVHIIRHIGGNAAVKRRAAILLSKAKQRFDFIKQRRQGKVSQFQLHLAGFDFRVIQDVIDDRHQRLTAGTQQSDVRCLLIGQVGILQHLRDTQNAVHGGANLMRHHRQERAFGLVGAFGFIASGNEIFMGLMLFRQVAIGIDPSDQLVIRQRRIRSAFKRAAIAHVQNFTLVLGAQ